MSNNPRHGRKDDGEAFLPDPAQGGPANGADAEFFGEEFLQSATTGENVEQEALDEVVDEEIGGPFIEEGADEDDADMVDTLPEPIATPAASVEQRLR